MTPFERSLRDELMAATSRRRSRRPLAAAGVIAAVTLGAALLVVTPEEAQADVEVTHEAGRVVVRLTDRANSPEAIEDATDDEGINLEIKAVPSGPSNLGRFVGSEASESDLRDVQRLDEDGVTFMAFSVPEGWNGKLTLLLGRRAEAGEPYVAFVDAYDPGEPLYCTGTLGKPLRLVEPLLAEYQVTVQTFDGANPSELAPLADMLDRGAGDAIVSGAVAVSSTQVIIDVGLTSPAGDPEEC